MDGAHTHGHGGGGLVLIVVAVMVIASAASAIARALETILIVFGCTVAAIVVLGAVWIAWQTRQDRPGRPIEARPVYQVPPVSRPSLEGSHNPALGPAREIHLHLHGLTPDQLAAIVTQRGAYLEEDR